VGVSLTLRFTSREAAQNTLQGGLEEVRPKAESSSGETLHNLIQGSTLLLQSQTSKYVLAIKAFFAELKYRFRGT
jgi:hypothetical protein